MKVEHLDISESSSDWAEQRFQIEIWAKPEAGGAYSGGAYIKKACSFFGVPGYAFNGCVMPHVPHVIHGREFVAADLEQVPQGCFGLGIVACGKTC